MAEFTTILDSLALMLRLGIHPHEEAPQRVIVSVEMTVYYPDPLGEDAIDRVLDYDFVRDGIRALAAERRFGLQETLCETIAALCLGDERVKRVRVRTMKTDIYPDAAIGCEVKRNRADVADQTRAPAVEDASSFTRSELAAAGFVGWLPLLGVREALECPAAPGVYVVFYPGSKAFEARSVGGSFKEKNPGVSLSTLEANWVDGAEVVYIGKADDLRRRLRQFADFGGGKPVGHWGGRLIWQLAARDQLIVGWKPCASPLAMESTLISEFRRAYGKPPFANAPHLMGR